MALPNFNELRESSDYLSHIQNGIWLMDDHRWACLVWDQHRSAEKEILIHADHHWDAVYDFHNSQTKELQMLELDSAGLGNLIQKNRYIRFDSFIAPAIKRGLFDEIHFFCAQDDETDEGLDEEFIKATNVRQYIHGTLDSLSSIHLNRPFVFDLCLDLFAKDAGCEPGNLWSATEIQNFINKTSDFFRRAKLVTISLSFGYSGTDAETRFLAEFVVPKIVAIRE